MLSCSFIVQPRSTDRVDPRDALLERHAREILDISGVGFIQRAHAEDSLDHDVDYDTFRATVAPASHLPQRTGY
ncbi:MAG: hypothetical protein KF850_38415 [Labilithrix sp.]|nr:hypothetical protein [Labilithrix sp.]